MPTPNTTIWQPIITGNESCQFLSMVQNISKTIESGYHNNELKYSSILVGNGGLCILNSYLLKHFKSKKYERLVQSSVEKTLNFVPADIALEYSFSIGVTGIAWAIQHLISNDLLECNFDDLFGDVIAPIKKYSITELNNNRYDYFESGLGYFLLLLEKSKFQPSDLVFFKEALELLIEKAINHSKNKIAWTSEIPNSNGVTVGYDLGLAHGVPGIVTILGILYEKIDALRKILIDIIEKSIDWILSTKVSDDKSIFRYFYINNSAVGTTLLRWCYGDIGIASCLYLTGRRLDNEQWQMEAIEIMKNCSNRLANEIDQIESAHLCHGTAGVGHIFNRFYQYTKIEEFKWAAVKCFQKTLEKAEYNDNNDVIFLVENGIHEQMLPKKPSAGILEGSAGIALALLSAVTDIEPKWDRCLLLS